MSMKTIVSLYLVIAVVMFFAGLFVSNVLGMNWVDRAAFLLCLGVVYLIGITFLSAYLGPKIKQNSESEHHTPS
ncbi:MAG: hypothetical protein D8M59_11180 [Planctomycetes bacterium]|nr:hypothetical protein [Planctomycetota bacterium]NOG54086.1 hypothetical protein [Planctomycetota bacterium]